MKTIQQNWKSLTAIVTIMAVGFFSYEHLNEIPKEITENDKAEWQYDADDLAISLSKQIEKIEKDPEDIKENDIKGLSDMCNKLENNQHLEYAEFVYNYDGIKSNCTIVSNFYLDNWGG